MTELSSNDRRAARHDKTAGREERGAENYTALKGVGRAMEVLEALAAQPMRAKDLADSLALKWATAYRTLAYLEGEDYLRRDEASGQYSIGPRLYMLGSAYLVTDRIAAVAPPHLRAASENMACAAQANEREGLRVITVAAVDSPSPIRKTSPGFTFPLGVAAKGRLLLAYAPDDVREDLLSRPLIPFTRFTITDPDAMRAEIERIRQQGHCVTREDLQVGVGSAAAPVRDRNGAVIGCLSLVVKSNRLDDEGFESELVATVDDAAHEVSVALGWRPAPAPPEAPDLTTAA